MGLLRLQDSSGLHHAKMGLAHNIQTPNVILKLNCKPLSMNGINQKTIGLLTLRDYMEKYWNCIHLKMEMDVCVVYCWHLQDYRTAYRFHWFYQADIQIALNIVLKRFVGLTVMRKSLILLFYVVFLISLSLCFRLNLSRLFKLFYCYICFIYFIFELCSYIN